jgi:hypothetical protein
MPTELTTQRDDSPPLLQGAGAPWALGQVTIDCGTKARRQRVVEMAVTISTSERVTLGPRSTLFRTDREGL